MSTFRQPLVVFLVFCFTFFFLLIRCTFVLKAPSKKKEGERVCRNVDICLGFVYLDMLFLYKMLKLCFGLFELEEAV